MSAPSPLTQGFPTQAPGPTQGQAPSANAWRNPAVVDRFRSFAERYVVARAGSFTKGDELQDGWQAVMDAKKLYAIIEQASTDGAQRGEGEGQDLNAAAVNIITARMAALGSQKHNPGKPRYWTNRLTKGWKL